MTQLHPAIAQYRKGQAVGLKWIDSAGAQHVQVGIVNRVGIGRQTGRHLIVLEFPGRSVPGLLRSPMESVTVTADDVQRYLDSVKPTHPQREEPTDLHVRKALALIARIGTDWQNTDRGQAIANPDEVWLRGMTKTEVSHLIDELRVELGEYI